jgi:hypothetical protein
VIQRTSAQLFLLLALATAFVLAVAVIAAPQAQGQELPDCPPEFPLCPPEDEDPEDPEDPGDPTDPGETDPPDDEQQDDPQVTETPVGGVATGTGPGAHGSLVPLALLGGALATAGAAGALARRRAAAE